MPQGGQEPDSYAARERYGRMLNNFLSNLHFDSATVGDTNTTALFGGNTPHALLYAMNLDDNEYALYMIEGDGTAVTQIQESATDTWGTSKGESSQNQNIYHSSTNSQYELENQTGGEKDYEVVSLRNR